MDISKAEAAAYLLIGQFWFGLLQSLCAVRFPIEVCQKGPWVTLESLLSWQQQQQQANPFTAHECVEQ